MSVIVKGMEMPKRCLDCPFMISRDNDDCVLQTEVENELARTWEELKASCPLVEIPTPHGRLIDADKFKETIDYYICEAGWSDAHNEALGWVKEFIDNEQAVIEAEGSEA